MIVLGLEVVYPSPGEPVPAKYSRKFDIICVHGLGRDSTKTWHHDAAGKTWISDPEFLGSLSLSARVLTYTYNSDLAANMSSASIGLHASELLELIGICYGQTGGGPTIFVAHGFGGIIVKKAIEMYSTSTHYPIAEDTTAGVVFLGTPHSTNDTDALLKAIEATAALHARNGLSPGPLPGMRDYAVSVRDTNAALRPQMVDKLEIGNLIEKLPTRFGPKGAESSSSQCGFVVPESCSRFRVASHQVMPLGRDHLGLASYASPADPDFRLLHTFLTIMSNRAKMNVKSRLSRPPMPPPMLSQSPPPGPGPGPGPGPVPRPGPPPMPSPSPSPPPPYGEKIDDDRRILPPPGIRGPAARAHSSFQDWARKKDSEAMVKARVEFENSLSGWSQTSTGSHILPIPGSGAWIRSSDSFKIWLDAASSTAILCHGPPGCGKTHWAKSVVNYLAAARPGDVVVSFFCDGAETGDTEPAILESLIYQIIRHRPEWFREIPGQYCERRFSSPRRSMDSLSDVLLHLKRSRTFGTVFFVIDAVDECATDFTRRLLRHVAAFVDRFGVEKSPAGTSPQQDEPGRVRFKFFFTSSPADVVRQAPCFTGEGPYWLAPTDRDIAEEVAVYVNTHVDRMQDKAPRPPDVAPAPDPDTIKKRIAKAAGTFFPYAVFACAELASGADPAACPEGLARYYDRQVLPLLQSVENERYSLEALCILSATRPGNITREQLVDCLGRIRGHAEPQKTASFVLPLISHQCSRLIDMSTDIVVKATHTASLQAHLDSHMPSEALHAYMADICLRYLMSPCFSPASMPLGSMTNKEGVAWLLAEYPFYLYAAHNWAPYLRDAGDEAAKVMATAERFLREDSPQFQAWCVCSRWQRLHTVDKMHPCTAMVLTGRADLIRPFLPTAWGVSDPGRPRPHEAAKKSIGIRSVWDDVLHSSPFSERRIRPFISADVLDSTGRSPLHFCCDRGATSALALFLTCPLSVDQRTGVPAQPDLNDVAAGETPLLSACRKYLEDSTEEPDKVPAHLACARLLLEAGADPNISTLNGTTCLHMASRADSTDLADLLLDFGAEVNVSDVAGQSVLQAATCEQNVPMLERLIEAGIDLDVKYSDAMPPITRSILMSQSDLFEMYARHVSDINPLNAEGLAPIHLAISTRRSKLLPCLLGRPDLRLDLLSEASVRGGSETALGVAVRTRDLRAALLLLAAGASPGYVPGMKAPPPLFSAVARCERLMVQALLDYGAPVNDLDRDTAAEDRTVLSLAIARQRPDHVRLLLDYGADPTTEEAYGLRSPLSRAVERGNIDVIRMLLEHAIPPPSVNYRTGPRTHVFFQIQDDDEGPEIARLLLTHGADVNESFAPGEQESPVHDLARDGLVETIKVLAERDPSLLDMQSEQGLMNRTPLHQTAFHGELKTVRYLLEAGARPDALSYWYNDTAFGMACANGQLETAKALYEAAPHVLDNRIYTGETPLLQACGCGDVRVARFLLERGADPRATDRAGVGAVRLALERDEGDAVRFVRLLVEHGLGPDEVVGCDGLTVLGEACRRGDVAVIRYLLGRGADPLRCQFCAHGAPGVRTALQVAVVFKATRAVEELLLRPLPPPSPSPDDVLDHLTDVDWAGENVLFANPRRRRVRETMTLLFRASEAVRAVTGRDVFADMASAVSVYGRTPVDWALRGAHVAAPPAAFPAIRAIIRRSLAALTAAGARTFEAHGVAMDNLVYCLTMLGGDRYDAQAVALSQMFLFVHDVADREDRFEACLRHLWPCDGCGETEDGPVMHLCRFCFDSVCPGCLGTHEPGEHSYLAIPRPETIDLDAGSVQEALDFLVAEFGTGEHGDDDGKGGSVGDVPKGTFVEDPASAATTLSLATMHAFGYLEIRRKAWTPYIGLARDVYQRLEPWEDLIRGRRIVIRDRLLSAETAPERLQEELGYFLSGGRRTAYQDEEGLRYGWVLEALGFMFQEPEGAAGRERGRGRDDDDADDFGYRNDSDDVETVA